MSEDTRLPMCPENLHEGMGLGPVHYGDTLTSHLKIASVDTDRAQLEIHIENQRGEKVLTGTAAVGLNDA